MNHRIEKVAAVLHHRTIRFELNGDRAAVHVIGVGAAVGRALRKHRSFAVAFMVGDDRFKSPAFRCELFLEPLER